MAVTNTDQFHYESTSVNTKTFTLTKAFAAGETIIGSLVTTSAGSQITMTSVTDSKSNTWVVPGAGSTLPPETFNASTVQVRIFHCHVTSSLAIGDTVTLNLGATASRWDVNLTGYNDIATTTPFDKKATNTGTSASMSSGTTAATTQAGELIVVAYGFGSTHSANIPAGWSASAQVNTTGGSSDRGLQFMWKYVTSTGTQTNTTTLDSSSVYAGVIATYKVTAFAGGTFSPGAATTSDSTVATAWTVTLKPDASAGGSAPPPTAAACAIGCALTSQANLPGETTTTMAAFESKSQRPMTFFRTFETTLSAQWFGSTNQRTLIANMGAGHTPMLSTKPDPYKWSDYYAGGPADAALTARAAEAVAFGKPFYLSIMHEPEDNVDNTPGSGVTAANYATMFRYFVTFMRNHGVTNAKFCLAWTGYRSAANFANWSVMYPGDSYVDLICWDPYDTLPTSAGYSATDLTESGLNDAFLHNKLGDYTSGGVDGFYKWATTTAPSKPLGISEYAVNETSGDDGTIKAREYIKMLDWLKNRPSVKFLDLWNGAGGAKGSPPADPYWYIDSSPKALAGWVTFCNDPYFFGTTSTVGGTTTVSAYNGTSWPVKPVKIYNGTSWVTKPAKVWSGNGWF